MKQRPLYSAFVGMYDFLFMGSVENEGDFIFEELRDRRLLGKFDLLDAGCGTGWLALEISKKGFKVTGIDRSAAMISESTKKRTCSWPPPVFWTGDVLELPPAYSFHCILGKGLFDDVPGRDEQLGYLRRFFEMLSDRSVVVFDVINWESEDKLHSFPKEKELSTKEGKFIYSTETTLMEKEKNLLVAETYLLKKGEEKITDSFELILPCWEQGELQKALLDIGFSKATFYGSYDPETKGEIKDRLVVVVEK